MKQHRNYEGPEIPIRSVRMLYCNIPAISYRHPLFEVKQRPNSSSYASGYWLVGASDSRHTGWWGPLPKYIAEQSVKMFQDLSLKTPCNPETWTERIRRNTRHSHSGNGAVALGALNLAIWDLAGQREDKPVWSFFTNNPIRTAVPVYFTCFGLNSASSNDSNWIKKIFQEGQHILKWRFPDPEKSLFNFGPLLGIVDEQKNRLAIDVMGHLNLNDAIALSHNLPDGLAWVEEPLPPWQMHEVSCLDLKSPLAAGEHCYGPHETVQLECAKVDIWQPDAVFCGGYGNFLAILFTAREKGFSVMPHGGGLLPAAHAISTPSSIQLLEWHIMLEPYRQAHFAHPVLFDENFEIHLPQHPGWAGSLRKDIHID